MVYVRKTNMLVESQYNELHTIIHVSNKEAEYKHTGQSISLSENLRGGSFGAVIMDRRRKGGRGISQ